MLIKYAVLVFVAMMAATLLYKQTKKIGSCQQVEKESFSELLEKILARTQEGTEMRQTMDQIIEAYSWCENEGSRNNIENAFYATLNKMLKREFYDADISLLIQLRNQLLSQSKIPAHRFVLSKNINNLVNFFASTAHQTAPGTQKQKLLQMVGILSNGYWFEVASENDGDSNEHVKIIDDYRFTALCLYRDITAWTNMDLLTQNQELLQKWGQIILNHIEFNSPIADVVSVDDPDAAAVA